MGCVGCLFCLFVLGVALVGWYLLYCFYCLLVVWYFSVVLFISWLCFAGCCAGWLVWVVGVSAGGLCWLSCGCFVVDLVFSGF